MSRSYKHKPYAAICGNGSAQQDKTMAARGVRRKHHQIIHIALRAGDYEIVLPHRLQCSHNDVYSWGRDGHQKWQRLDHRDWHRYLEAMDPEIPCRNHWMRNYYVEHYGTWPPQWYEKMLRK